MSGSVIVPADLHTRLMKYLGNLEASGAEDVRGYREELGDCEHVDLRPDLVAEVAGEGST